MIILLMNDGTFKVPLDIKNNGAYPKAISDPTEINEARETYGSNYVGAYDYYQFEIDDKNISIMSKYSYEQLWKISMAGKNGNTHVFGIEEAKRPLEYRKYLRTISLLLLAYNENEKGDSKFIIGQKDPNDNANLFHDALLYHCAIIYSGIKLKNKKSSALREMYDTIIKTISHYPEFDSKEFQPLLEYFEKELPNYSQKSFVNRLFKK